MLLLFILTVLWTAIFIGIGSWVDKKESFIAHLVLGFSLTLLLIQSVFLFLPLHPLFTLSIIIFGLVSFLALARREALWRQIWNFSFYHKVLCVVCFAMIILILLAGSFPIEWYDSLLYHLPLLKLYTYGPLIPGIALLHHRFGFTSSTFSFTAFSTLLPGIRQSLSLFNTMISVWLCLVAWACMSQRKHLHSFSFYLTLSSILLAFSINGLGLVGTLAPEIGVFFWLLMASIFVSKKKYGLALLASVLSFSAKSSAFPFILGFGFLVLYHKTLQKRAPLFLSALIFIIWTVTSSLQTGYLLFPLEFTRAPLLSGSDLPVSEVVNLRSIIYEFARKPAENSTINSELAWFLQQFRPQIPIAVQTFSLAILGLFPFGFKKIKKEKNIDLYILTLMFWSVFVIGYASAPDLRLLWPFLSLALATTFSLSATALRSRMRDVPGLLLMGLFLLSLPLWIPTKRLLRKIQVLSPVETIYNQDARTYWHPNGFSYTMPESGDDRCGMAEAICIPNPDDFNSYTYDLGGQNRVKSVRRREL